MVYNRYSNSKKYHYPPYGLNMLKKLILCLKSLSQPIFCRKHHYQAQGIIFQEENIILSQPPLLKFIFNLQTTTAEILWEFLNFHEKKTDFYIYFYFHKINGFSTNPCVYSVTIQNPRPLPPSLSPPLLPQTMLLTESPSGEHSLAQFCAPLQQHCLGEEGREGGGVTEKQGNRSIFNF